jgi:hypothetical protein
MRPLSPTAWVAVIVAAVAAFVALGTAGAVAARGDTFTAAKRKSVGAGPQSPAPGSQAKPQPTTTQHDGMLENTGDEHPGRWGFVPEVYFLGGADDQPDPGLPMCSDEDLARVA